MKYLRLPKELFTNPKYKNLSANAKLLYALLLDRHSLSKSNNLTDDNGEIVVFFTREEARETLGIGKEATFKCFADLKQVGLLREGFVGVGKVRMLYIQKPTCKVEKSAPVRSEKSDNNKTDYNNTELNKTDINKKESEIDSFYYTVLKNVSYNDEGLPF